jgi:hypothetical protein
VILHQPEEQHLILVTHRSKERVLEDGGWLVLELSVGSRYSGGRKQQERITQDKDNDGQMSMKGDLRTVQGDSHSLSLQAVYLFGTCNRHQ